MELGGLIRVHKGSPVILFLRQINPISRRATYFINIYSNIVLSSTLRLSRGLFPVGYL